MHTTPDRPLKLVHCTNEIGEGGGIATINRTFHRFWDRSLVDPVFLATSDLPPEQIAYAGDAPYLFTSQEGRFRQMVEHFRDADIVQFFGAFDPVACEAAKRTGVPILIELLHNHEKGQVYEDIDLTCCVSRLVERNQVHPERVRLITNGIDLARFPKREGITGSKDKIILLQAGRADKVVHFHLDELADDLLPRHPGLEIWMMGAGYDKPSTDRIKYLGQVSDVGAVYRQADLLVHLSRKESFGLVVVEAMASGCLPLVSGDSGPAEIVDSGTTGWVIPGDDRTQAVRAIVRALELLGTPQWQAMQATARQTVDTLHTAERFVQEHEQAYLDLYRAKGRRTHPGPMEVPIPPEVHMATAMHRYNGKKVPEMTRAIENFVTSPQPLRHGGMAYVATRLARFMNLHEGHALADSIYRKMHRSGFRDEGWMTDWLQHFPEDGESPFPVEDLLALSPHHEQGLMLAADLALQSGDFNRGFHFLETFLQHYPDNAQVRSSYDDLKSKYINSL